MLDALRHFRVIVKNRDHATDSLTLRCFDLLALHAEEARALSASRRSHRGRHIVVREVRDSNLTAFQHEQLLARLQRYRTEFS